MEKSLSLAFTFTPQGVACTVTEPESGNTKTVPFMRELYKGKMIQTLDVDQEIGSWVRLWLDEYNDEMEESK